MIKGVEEVLLVGLVGGTSEALSFGSLGVE